jgi:uncharacterized protein (DUF58 family)
VEVEEVFARFRAIKHGLRKSKKSLGHRSGEHRSAFRGSGYEIVGVDQWRPGQPLTDIAWSLSQRTYPDKLFSVERMEPKEFQTLFVVDLSYSMLFQISHESNKALLLLDLIGGMGLTLAKLQDPVGLLAFSNRIDLYLKPKLGSGQIFYMAHQIFERLKLEREFPTRRRADFSVALQFVASRLKVRHSVVFMSDVVDLVNDQESIDFKMLSRLSWKHDVMVLILDDPHEFAVPGRFRYIRTANMETGEQTVIAARKAPAIRRSVEEAREALQARLWRECGVGSVVLTPQNWYDQLSRFLVTRTPQ